MSRVAEALLDTATIPSEFEARETLHGLAIDSYGAGADNAWKAGRRETIFVPFLTSVVDVAKYDPQAQSVRKLADDIERGKNGLTRTVDEQKMVALLSETGPTDTITIFGHYNAVSGEVLVTEPKKTRTHVKKHTPGDKRLLEDGSYLRGLELARNLGATTHPNPSSRTERAANARETVSAYGKTHSLAIARFATAQQIPQIYRVFPVTEHLEGRSFSMSSTSSQPTTHEAFSAPYAKHGSPTTSLEAWINGLAISIHMEHGEVPFGTEELEVISGWIHAKRTRAKLERVKNTERQQRNAA